MIPAAAAEPRTEQLVADLPAQKKPMRIYGALFDTYILIEYEDRLLMVDQHAVHERLLFDQLMASFGQERLGQEMLTPITVPPKAAIRRCWGRLRLMMRVVMRVTPSAAMMAMKRCSRALPMPWLRLPGSI